MGRRDVLAWTAIVALALVAGGLGVWARQRVAPPPPAPAPAGFSVVQPGQALPPLALPGLHGGPDRQLAGPGRVRLINYWASWCGPCRQEMPALDGYAFNQGETGIEVIGIALDTPAAARAFAAQVKVRFPLLVEPASLTDSSVRLGNQRQVLPYTVLIDAQGRLVKSHYGAFADASAIAAWAEAP